MHCLPMSHKKDARFIWVTSNCVIVNCTKIILDELSLSDELFENSIKCLFLYIWRIKYFNMLRQCCVLIANYIMTLPPFL